MTGCAGPTSTQHWINQCWSNVFSIICNAGLDELVENIIILVYTIMFQRRQLHFATLRQGGAAWCNVTLIMYPPGVTWECISLMQHWTANLWHSVAPECNIPLKHCFGVAFFLLQRYFRVQLYLATLFQSAAVCCNIASECNFTVQYCLRGLFLVQRCLKMQPPGAALHLGDAIFCYNIG